MRADFAHQPMQHAIHDANCCVNLSNRRSVLRMVVPSASATNQVPSGSLENPVMLQPVMLLAVDETGAVGRIWTADARTGHQGRIDRFSLNTGLTHCRRGMTDLSNHSIPSP